MIRFINGDCREELRQLPDGSVNCCVTSPPYFRQRDYNHIAQIGMESAPLAYTDQLVKVFREVRRILREDGTVWLNLGDSYAPENRGEKAKPRADPAYLRYMQGEHMHADLPTNRESIRAIQSMGIKRKDLMMIPARTALALQDDGWWLRSDIIWAKPNGMPGSQIDRPTSSHEHIFLLSKSEDYWSDFDAIKTPPRESTLVRLAQDIQSQAGSHRANGGAKTNGPMKAVGTDKQRGHGRRHAGFNDRWDQMKKSQQQALPAMMRDVWFVSPKGYDEAHFAVMPEEIARRCVLAGCPVGGMVLDPFSGAGTTAIVADRLGRNAIGIDLNQDYEVMARERLIKDAGLFAEFASECGQP